MLTLRADRFDGVQFVAGGGVFESSDGADLGQDVGADGVARSGPFVDLLHVHRAVEGWDGGFYSMAVSRLDREPPAESQIVTR